MAENTKLVQTRFEAPLEVLHYPVLLANGSKEPFFTNPEFPADFKFDLEIMYLLKDLLAEECTIEEFETYITATYPELLDRYSSLELVGLLQSLTVCWVPAGCTYTITEIEEVDGLFVEKIVDFDTEDLENNTIH